MGSWHIVGFSLDMISSFLTNATLLVDATTVSTGSFPGIMQDQLEYLAKIGAEDNYLDGTNFQVTNFYTGFLYRICWYNNPLDDLIDDIGPDCSTTVQPIDCEVCPSDACLLECDVFSFGSITECKSCPVECASGCEQVESCNVCEDKECELCEVWSD
jgi:hypothetical protein